MHSDNTRDALSPARYSTGREIQGCESRHQVQNEPPAYLSPEKCRCNGSTPEHNGKVERSRRKAHERFCATHTFYSFQDIAKQLKRCNDKDCIRFPYVLQIGNLPCRLFLISSVRCNTCLTDLHKNQPRLGKGAVEKLFFYCMIPIVCYFFCVGLCISARQCCRL